MPEPKPEGKMIAWKWKYSYLKSGFNWVDKNKLIIPEAEPPEGKMVA